MTDIAKVLEERGSRYGEFHNHAKISQELKSMMTSSGSWARLTPDMKEALEMIQHKVARILNGDPSYADNWIDIAGYSKLVADRLDGESPKCADVDGNGWIEWSGGECPVSPGCLIDVRHRDGVEFFACPAVVDLHCKDWSHDGSSGDIIAYRLSPSKA